MEEKLLKEDIDPAIRQKVVKTFSDHLLWCTSRFITKADPDYTVQCSYGKVTCFVKGQHAGSITFEDFRIYVAVRGIKVYVGYANETPASMLFDNMLECLKQSACTSENVMNDSYAQDLNQVCDALGKINKDRIMAEQERSKRDAGEQFEIQPPQAPQE